VQQQPGVLPGLLHARLELRPGHAFLFGSLARTMREVEFAHATNAEG